MPVQQISVKNSDIERCSMVHEPIYTQENARLGSTSSNISYSNNDICRICHCEADAANPLLSPCYCSGSLKYVHQSCLQQWLTASETRSCELCKFNFILHTKIKPINEWRRLEMSSVERRRLLCAILFHFVAAMCVVWSLFVLIDRAAEEVQRGLIAWPFWTKLVVVAVGFTGGAVFMYIQCRQYLHLCARWKAHNRIILVQNAPEKIVAPPSPTFAVPMKPSTTRAERSSQVVANIESGPRCTDSAAPADSNLLFGERSTVVVAAAAAAADSSSQLRPISSTVDIQTPPPELNTDYHRTDTPSYDQFSNAGDPRCSDKFLRMETPCFDPLELNIQEMLALDIENTIRRSKTAKNSVVSLGSNATSATDNSSINRNNKSVFKSLPNLSSSSENLLP